MTSYFQSLGLCSVVLSSLLGSFAFAGTVANDLAVRAQREAFEKASDLTSLSQLEGDWNCKSYSAYPKSTGSEKFQVKFKDFDDHAQILHLKGKYYNYYISQDVLLHTVGDRIRTEAVLRFDIWHSSLTVRTLSFRMKSGTEKETLLMEIRDHESVCGADPSVIEPDYSVYAYFECNRVAQSACEEVPGSGAKKKEHCTIL